MQPQAYNRETDFTDRTGDDTDNSAINLELDAAALSINEIRDNLALLQRDDGALANGIVTSDSLDQTAYDAINASINAAVNEAQLAADSANNAAFSANTARDTAVAAKTSAETARDASQLNATSSANSAAASLSSKNAAAVSEANSLSNKNASSTSAGAAADSAAAAAASATLAGQKADLATTNGAAQVTLATAQANIATSKATDSANSANASSNAASVSTTKASEAAASAAAALANKNATDTNAASALLSKNAAATSETNANTSKVAAQAAQTSAESARDLAIAAKTSAETAATNSANSSAAALTSKNAAATSETNSANSATASANSAAAALTSKNNAATSETNSANSASAAASSASSASSSSSLSADWAEKTTGLVGGIGYSAKYWASQALAAAGGGVSSFNGRTGSVSLLSADVITALGFTPEDMANKNANNGYAGLDSSGKVPSSLLPSYVDDVLEFTNLASFPGSGEVGKIYTALDTNKTYRWSGSVYVEISGSPGSTDAVTEGATNLYFTNARASAAAPVQSVSGRTGNVTLAVGDVSGAAADSGVVHKTGDETVAGIKTLSSAPVLSGGAKFSSAGWSVTETSTKLYFAYDGVNKASLDSSGNLIVLGNVTAYGTP